MDLHRNRGTCRRKELSAKEPSSCDCMASWIVVGLQSKVDAVLPARGIIIVAGPNKGVWRN